MKSTCASAIFPFVLLFIVAGCGGAVKSTTTPVSPSNGGSSITPGQLAVSPGSIDFGSVQVDGSAWKPVQLTNSGGSNLTLSAASTSGPGFRVTGLTLPADIAPGQSLSFNIGFNPSNSGSANGSVQLSNNGSTPSVSVSLSGTGLAVLPHEVTANWDASVSPAIGYNVYRAGNSGGPYAKINSMLVASTSYTDTAVTAGSTYYYVVTSVATNNAESTYSNEARATVPTP